MKMKNWWDDNAPTPVNPAPARPGQLCLYVAGAGPRAALAETNVRRCCERHFAGQYELEVVDLQHQPELAGREQLLALPTLVRRLPAPRRYLVGTLVDETQLLASLGFGE